MPRLAVCALAIVPAPMLLPAIAMAQAPATQTRDVDTLMLHQMAARHIPGGAVAVVSHGKIVMLKAYGLSDVEHRVPATEHTVFALGSITKQFTATAIMMLVEDGKLSLDDLVTRVLDSLPAAWNAITIRHLLQHTSGIAEYSAVPEFRADFRTDRTPRQVVELMASTPLAFTPGEKHSYTNSGYFLLGMVIEKRSGMDYGTFLRTRIFSPLGMTDSRYNDWREIIPGRARGYTFVEYALQNAEFVSPSVPFAAGGIVSSAADMAKWMQAQGSPKLLTAAHWQAMWTKAVLNDGTSADYGFGWNVRSSGTHKRLEHSGGLQGFSSYIADFVGDSLGAMFLFNSDVSTGRLGAELFGIYLPAARPSPPKAIADADTATTRFLKRVAIALSNGMGDSAWYTPNVQRFYFPDRIKARKAIGELGELRSFDLIDVSGEPARQKRTYRGMMGTTAVHFTFWVTREHRIDGVDFAIE